MTAGAADSMRAAPLVLLAGLALGLAGCGSAPLQTDAEARRERLIDLNDRAQRAVARGELRRATAFYRDALRLAEAIEDFRAIGINALNLAAVYQALDEPAAADAALERVLATPSRFERSLGAEAAGRKALLALEAGRLEPAEQWLARAERECPAPACAIEAALLNLRGWLVLERGAVGEARAILARSFAASRSQRNREEEANALRLDGRAAVRQGALPQAVTLLQRALDIDKELALPRKIALDLLALAEVELSRGSREAARDYAQRALDVSRASGNLRQRDAAVRLIERAK